MTVVDAQGRLFGRWNFVDVSVAMLVLLIGPVGYAAFLLFRTPDPKLVSIQPNEVVQGPNQRVIIQGLNLRPYLRVSFDTMQGRTFMFQDTARAEVELNAMPPGTYDVVLYDFGQERDRLKQALTVRANSSLTPTEDAIVVGRFIGLSAEAAALVRKGMPLPFPGDVIEVAPPRASVPKVFFGGLPVSVPTPNSLEVPAVLKLSCFMKLTGGQPECGREDFTLRPKHILTVPSSGNTGLSFQIDDVRAINPVSELTLRVKLLGVAEAVTLAKNGDVQVDPEDNPFALIARISAIDPVRSPSQTDRLATLVLRAQRLPGGWWNGSVFVRIGGQLSFQTEKYAVTAQVLGINEPHP